MDRRLFLKNLGFTAVAVTAAPLVSFFTTSKRMIYKVDTPAFMLFYTSNDSNKVECIFKFVNTCNMSLQQLCKRYPNDDIFFYQESNSPTWVRAYVHKKNLNEKILNSENYTIYE